MIDGRMKKSGLKVMYLLYSTFILFGGVLAEEEVEGTGACPKENLFVGVNFSKSKYISFPTEPEERKDWNMILLKTISWITHKRYFLTYPSYLEKYAECQNMVVQCILDSYFETNVGGGERTGTISLTFLFFKNPVTNVPEKKISIEATGGSDYGHSNPIESAIKEACSDLQKKITQNGYDESEGPIDVCKDDNFLVGIDFSKSKYIEFKLEQDEVNGCNVIIRDAVVAVTGNAYQLISQDQIACYAHCKNAVVQCQLESYHEMNVGGGERTGTIALTFLIFSNPSSTSPEKEIFVEATGRSDYGHSNPLRYAIEKACYQFKNKLMQSGMESSEEVWDVCKNENMFVGIDIRNSEYIDFKTESDEVNRWNSIILGAVSAITKKPFFLTFTDQLERYRDCQGSVVKCQLDSYTETYEGDGERKGNITLTFQFFKNIRDSIPEKIRTVSVTGDAERGHSTPLENAIEEACMEFRRAERGNEYSSVEFGPSLGLHYVGGMGGYGLNFDLGYLNGLHNCGLAIALGKEYSKDTLISVSQKVIKEFYLLGIGFYYGCRVYKNPYVNIIPKLKVGFWHYGITNTISEPSKNDNNPYGQNHWVVHEQKIPHTYYLFPCIDIRAGMHAKWGRTVLGAYIGDGPPIWTVQLGILFTGK